MHQSICNLNIPPGHLTLSLPPGVGHLTLDCCEGGKFDSKPQKVGNLTDRTCGQHVAKREGSRKMLSDFCRQDIAFVTEWLTKYELNKLRAAFERTYEIAFSKKKKIDQLVLIAYYFEMILPN